jgi:hypothetical protein
MEYDMRKSIKARELKRAFAAIPDDSDVCFGPVLGNHIGSLTYYRTKWVGDNLVNVQFNEDFEVTMDPWEELQKPQSFDSGPTLQEPNS